MAKRTKCTITKIMKKIDYDGQSFTLGNEILGESEEEDQFKDLSAKKMSGYKRIFAEYVLETPRLRKKACGKR